MFAGMVFFGFKLHLIINDKGEILSFYLAKGNGDDHNFKVMKSMTENLFGKLFGDKGYISKAFLISFLETEFSWLPSRGKT